jgi:ubiquitin C-terminal hydrolase
MVCRDFESNRWFKIDDSQYELIGPWDVQTENAYILVYRKNKMI